MKSRLKYPLTLYVVWHPDFVEGKLIAHNIYSIFCRDIEQPLSRGLGIPVYFRSTLFDKAPIPIDIDNSKRNAIILLIDQQYFIDKNFGIYTETLVKSVSDNTRLFPVALCRQASNIKYGLESYQFIRAYNDGLSPEKLLEFSLNKIKTELLHDCARLLMNIQPSYMDKEKDRIPSPVKLFLSHAKKDGEDTAKQFKAFVDAELKLDVFFDTVDIADGYIFEKQIEDNVKNSALIVFLTDAYSSREWCRIEVLVAKRNKSSIVVVHNIKNGEKRSFPYLGNTPTMTYNEKTDTFFEIVNLTLYQVLNNKYQLELLESFHQEFHNEGIEFISLTSPPELFNYIDIYKKKVESKNHLVILYPEPPLGAEELKILNELDKDVEFITPILLPTLTPKC